MDTARDEADKSQIAIRSNVASDLIQFVRNGLGAFFEVLPLLLNLVPRIYVDGLPCLIRTDFEIIDTTYARGLTSVQIWLTGCHSYLMILREPPLSAKTWEAFLCLGSILDSESLSRLGGLDQKVLSS